MRILLLGATGRLGWELQRALAPLGELLAPGRGDAGSPLDLRDPAALGRRVRALRPEVIVNAAAYTAVDRAESEPALVQTVNADAPGALADAAAALDAWLVHYSTDQVFDGRGGAPYHEDAPTAPLGVYGRSKLAAEQRVRASGCRHLILRTGWLHAPRGDNFALAVLRLARERDALAVVADQLGAPTGADLVADVSAQVLRTLPARPEAGGTYHLVAAGDTTRHAYACWVLDWARRHGLPLRVAPGAVRAVTTREFPTPAARPLDTRLDTTRLRTQFGLVLPDWRTGVQRMLDEALRPDGGPAR